MQIREIEIGRFGIFSDYKISAVLPGLNIVYGKNEFGKTTLLEFVRWVLFGFEKRRNGNPYTPVGGGHPSGKLICELSNGEPLIITRTAGARNSRVTVQTADREFEGQEHLDAYLGHASRKIFQNIYAFTLGELENFGSLMEDEIKNKIYGAGMGLGRTSISSVQKLIEDKRDGLFKSRRDKQLLNQLCNEIRVLEEKKRHVQDGLKHYDELETKIRKLEEENTVSDTQIREWDSRRLHLETRRDLFRDFVELESAETELNRLEPIVGFPENGFSSFNTLRSEIETRKARLEEENHILEKLKVRLEQDAINEPLLQKEKEVTRLRQLTESVRSALRDKIMVEMEQETLEDKIRTEIERIGREWNEDRVRAFDISEKQKIFVQEQHDALYTAKEAGRHLKNKLELHREHKAAESTDPRDRPAWFKKIAIGLMALGGLGITGAGVYGDIPLGLFSLIALVLGFILYRSASQKPAGPEQEDRLEFLLMGQIRQAKKSEDEKFEAWREWLKKSKLAQELTPLAVKDIFGSVRGIQGMLDQRAGLGQRLERMRATETEAAGLVQALVTVVPGFQRSDDLSVNIAMVCSQYDETQKIFERLQALAGQIDEQAVKVQGLECQHAGQIGELKEFIRLSGAENEADFLRRHQILERRRGLQKIILDKQQGIQSRVGIDAAFHEFMESMRTTQPEAVEQELGELSARLEALNEGRKRLNQSIGETRAEITQWASNDDLLLLQNELEIKKLKLKNGSRDWVVATLALDMLEKAKREYEKNRQPGVIKAAEVIFSDITGGVYKRIIKPIDTDDLLIENGGSEPKQPGQMSRGTREQLYLAMRFGLIQEYESRTEPLPILMDDVFVNFDDDRRSRLAEILQRFSQTRQIIILSCHRHSLDLCTDHGANQLIVK